MLSTLSRFRGIIYRVLGYPALLYLGVMLVLMFFENRLVYPLSRADEDWTPPPTREFQDIELVTATGIKLHGWWLPCPDSDATMLLLHGNGRNLSCRGDSVQKLGNYLKVSVLIIDYPGYGKSEGSPSEMGCYAAADAAYEWLVHEQKIDPRRLILYGESLGGGVAVDLASRKEHGALVLIKTFSSMPDVGQRLYPWLPVRLLMRNRFNSINKIDHCPQPVFVASSPDDTLIPFALGEKLFEAANEPKEFVTLRGGHNDKLSSEFFNSLTAFLRRHEVLPALVAVGK